MPDTFLTPGTTTDYQEVAPVTTGGTAAQGGRVIATRTDGTVDPSFLGPGIGQEQYIGTADGALTAGDWVYRSTNGIARASAASGGNWATGFVTASSANGAAATMYFVGTNAAVTGVTASTIYYLSDTTPGGFTTTVPSGTGKLIQRLGEGTTTSGIVFQPGPVTKRA